MCKTKIQQDFITKNNNNKQGFERKTYPKLMFNKLKLM